MSLWGNCVGAAQDHLLFRSGGKMAGDIDMSGFAVRGLGTPTEDDQAASKKYVEDTVKDFRKPFTVTLSAANWQGDNAPYTQTAAVKGILAADRPYYGPVYSSDTKLRIREKAAYSCVDDLDTADDTVTFTCFDSKPDVDLVIQLEVFR